MVVLDNHPCLLPRGEVTLLRNIGTNIGGVNCENLWYPVGTFNKLIELEIWNIKLTGKKTTERLQRSAYLSSYQNRLPFKAYTPNKVLAKPNAFLRCAVLWTTHNITCVVTQMFCLFFLLCQHFGT